MSPTEGDRPGAGDLIGEEEAADLLEVTPGRLGALVDEGVLRPAEEASGHGRRFRRGEVLAARQLGA